MYKKYLFIKKIFLSNFRKLDFPYKLTFALTYKCNLRCRICRIWQKEKRPELSTDEIEEFFKISNRFSWVGITGGEIFLREDLINIIQIIFKYCRSLCVLHFPTNGQLTERIIDTVKKIRNLKKDATLVITVSMDGPKDLNNELRDDGDAWDRSLDTFIKLKALSLKFVYLGYTLSKYNSGKLEEMLFEVKKYYPQITYGDIHVNIAHASKHYYNNLSLKNFLADTFSIKDVENLLKARNTIIKNFLEKRFLRLTSDYLASKQMPLRCQALSATCFIDPYGDIYRCSLYDRKISNIRDIDYDLFKFWSGDKAADIRKEILNKRCNGCWTPCEAYPSILGSILKPKPHF